LSNALLLYPSAFGLAAVIWLFVSSAVRKFGDPDKLLETAHRRQTAELPPGNYLFLRCSGDEAAAGLSAAQFIAWLSVKVSQVLQLITRPALSSTWKGLVYIMLLGPTATWWTSFVSPADRDQFIHSLGIPFWLYSTFWVAYCLLVACAVTALLIFLTQGLTSWAFGWTEVRFGFFAELAIEPLPFGAHSMVHIDWNADPLRLKGVTHSWTYAHPDAIRYVQEWVKRTLQ
jgi:hypothetical protein